MTTRCEALCGALGLAVASWASPCRFSILMRWHSACGAALSVEQHAELPCRCLL